MRTFHLLKTPDILLANDIRLPVCYFLVNSCGEQLSRAGTEIDPATSVPSKGLIPWNKNFSIPFSNHLWPEISAQLLCAIPTAHFFKYANLVEPVLNLST
jgi:hypothetical protein